jgi:retron-type reverse transcriptase
MLTQQVVKQYLEPRLVSIFSKNSYGYRPNRSAHAAIEIVRRNVLRYSWVIDLDIQEFFESVDHSLLLKALERHVSEKWVLLYIKRWLEAPVILED